MTGTHKLADGHIGAHGHRVGNPWFKLTTERAVNDVHQQNVWKQPIPWTTAEERETHLPWTMLAGKALELLCHIPTVCGLKGDNKIICGSVLLLSCSLN